MFIEFDAADLACGSGPAAPTDWLTVSSGPAEIHGRSVGFPEVYLYHSNDLAIASESITEALNRLDRLDRSVVLSSFSISRFLHTSLVPPPHTEWEEVWRVGMSDTAILTATPSGIDVTWNHEYPFLEESEPGENEASASKLLELLTASVDRRLRSRGSEGMLSSGEGRPVRCRRPCRRQSHRRAVHHHSRYLQRSSQNTTGWRERVW